MTEDKRVKSGPLKGYKIIGHIRDTECPACTELTYCKNCRVCVACGYTPDVGPN